MTITKKEKIYAAMLIPLLALLCFLSWGDLNGQTMLPKSTGQQAVTGTAAVLPTLGSGVACLKAVPGNTITIYLGLTPTVTTSTGYPLAASESVCTQVTNLNTFYVVASTTGASVSWIVFNN